ncbi:omega-amidase [Dysgonomonadaceae bacterium PH5-43]|nr:omega-amidase [Dysgonomonadaceae bacterium PH5-43]
MKELRVSCVQSSIEWEDKLRNLTHFYSLISQLKGKSDVVVLPETFTTGFSMKASHLAETIEEDTIKTIKSWAQEFGFAIAGSFISKEDNNTLYNKAFFVTPEGDTYFYNKRHLFRMGEENKVFSPGDTYSIINYKGWNIRLIVCYDLRFPVWIRNKNNEYDLLICVANWPKARAKVWSSLLVARAIENLCYVCGVNRVGEDGNGLKYQGDSLIIDYKGNALAEAINDEESLLTVSVNKDKLNDFREKFPAWKDADDFTVL